MAISHPFEPIADADRALAARTEPRSLRTYTPTHAVLARSAGIFHWTPDGRRLFDFTSGVLVANLGHNPIRWTERFFHYMGWPAPGRTLCAGEEVPEGYFAAVPMTAYNAITPVEAEASRRLLTVLRRCKGGQRMESVMWAASGSEAIQKALWASMAFDKRRPLVLATRHGFHGKKGLSLAISGSETDHERDPRVKFIRFPMSECHDLSQRNHPFDPAPFAVELEAVWQQFGTQIGTLVTEPYLGGGGSYHPHPGYLQLLERFCRERKIVFILDEVQANFGRTGTLFAFERYGVQPDIVVLGKGLGNGIPVAAAVGAAEIFDALEYGDTSDTWSANPINAAAVLATLDEFETRDILGDMQEPSNIIEAGLVKLKEYGFLSAVRGEPGGMVWGVEFADYAGQTANAWANAFILACYRGSGEPLADGIHLLGVLAKKVVRISPPLTITTEDATHAMRLMHRTAAMLAEQFVLTPL